MGVLDDARDVACPAARCASGATDRREPELARPGARGRWKKQKAAAGALLALVLASLSLPASGDTPKFGECTRKATESDIEGAKGAHKAATQFFERADYDRAIQYWNDAYTFDCSKPTLLLNIANAYEKKGDKASAITTLEAYLQRAPTAPDADTIASKIANLKASIKPAPTATSTSSAPPPTATGAPPPPPLPEESPSLVPWVVVGIGGAAAIAGAVLLPIGLSAVSSAEENCPDRQCTSQDSIDEGNSGRTKATIGGVALGAGGVLIAGGLVWGLAFNQPASETSALRVVPVAGATQQGVIVTGSF